MEETKYYYTITEVSEMLGVNASLLRYWETEFPALRPEKTKNGSRRYKQTDIDLLRRIHHLTKEQGYTLEGAREQLKKRKAEPEETQQVVETLKSLRTLLEEIREKL